MTSPYLDYLIRIFRTSKHVLVTLFFTCSLNAFAGESPKVNAKGPNCFLALIKNLSKTYEIEKEYVFKESKKFEALESEIKKITAPQDRTIALNNLAKEYKKAGWIQESIWASRQAGDHKTAELLEQKLIKSLKNGKIIKSHIFGEGNHATDTYIVKLENNTYGVFKPKIDHVASQPRHEVAAFELDRITEFDKVPATVEREIDGVKGSLQYFIRDGDRFAGESKMYERSDELKISDVLMAQYDRLTNNPNFIFRIGGQEAIVDHGAAFDCSLLGRARKVNRSKTFQHYIGQLEALELLKPVSTDSDHLEKVMEYWMPQAPAIEKIRRIPDATFKTRLSPYLEEWQIDDLLQRKKSLIKMYDYFAKVHPK